LRDGQPRARSWRRPWLAEHGEARRRRTPWGTPPVGGPEASRGALTLWASATQHSFQVVRGCRMKPDPLCLSRDSDRGHWAAMKLLAVRAGRSRRGCEPATPALPEDVDPSLSPGGIAGLDRVGDARMLRSPAHGGRSALPSDAAVPVIVGGRCGGPRQPATARWTVRCPIDGAGCSTASFLAEAARHNSDLVGLRNTWAVGSRG
jgi:hypothetical protein